MHNVAEDVHGNHAEHLLESMVEDKERMAGMVPSCLDGMMHVLVDDRLSSLTSVATDDAPNATLVAFERGQILIELFSCLLQTFLCPLPPPSHRRNLHHEFHPSKVHSRP